MTPHERQNVAKQRAGNAASGSIEKMHLKIPPPPKKKKKKKSAIRFRPQFDYKLLGM